MQLVTFTMAACKARPVAWLLPPAFGFVPRSMAAFRW